MPSEGAHARAKKQGSEESPRKLDPRLVERLERVIDHFRQPGDRARLSIVSGYRPKSSGSYHSAGRALDFRIEGVKNEELFAYCKTLPDTGCGFYPNNTFFHIDARDEGAGHAAWVDPSKAPPPGIDRPDPPRDAGSSPASGAAAVAAAAMPLPAPHAEAKAPSSAMPPAEGKAANAPNNAMPPAVMAAPIEPSKGKPAEDTRRFF
jgi:hypothetical protein